MAVTPPYTSSRRRQKRADLKAKALEAFARGGEPPRPGPRTVADPARTAAQQEKLARAQGRTPPALPQIQPDGGQPVARQRVEKVQPQPQNISGRGGYGYEKGPDLDRVIAKADERHEGMVNKSGNRNNDEDYTLVIKDGKRFHDYGNGNIVPMGAVNRGADGSPSTGRAVQGLAEQAAKAREEVKQRRSLIPNAGQTVVTDQRAVKDELRKLAEATANVKARGGQIKRNPLTPRSFAPRNARKRVVRRYAG